MAINPQLKISVDGEFTANEAFLDAVIRHQIYLLRVSGTIRNQVIDLLNATEQDIATRIRGQLFSGTSTQQRKQLEDLIFAVQEIRRAPHREINETLTRELIAVAKAEPTFLAAFAASVLPVRINLTLPAPQTLETLVTTHPFEGRVLSSWAERLEADDLARLEQQIRIGYLQGESTKQIAQRIVGTAAAQGTNGVFQITRRDAQSIARTAVNSIANAAKRQMFQANADIFDQELYVATLDSRTTPICRSLDGTRYSLGEGPIPPLHWNCRSIRVAIFNGQVIGERPFKATSERLLLTEYARLNGLDGVTSKSALPFGHRGAFDDWARAAARSMIGQVPAATTYQQWLSRQSAAFQDDVLGTTRGRLFRRGDLTLDKFVNRQGDELTLAELADRHRANFLAAGLDPDDF